MDKKILIGGLVVIVAIIAVVIIQQPTEEYVPAEKPVEKPVFEVDETIPAEFCRQFIARTQLRKITGYEKDAFTFKEAKGNMALSDIPAKMCDIKINGKGISISLPIVPINYKIVYERAREEILEAPKGVEIRKIQNVGEKAFSLSMVGINDIPEAHIIVFLDVDINQIIEIMSIGIDYKTTLNFAKQVEANIIEKPAMPGLTDVIKEKRDEQRWAEMRRLSFYLKKHTHIYGPTYLEGCVGKDTKTTTCTGPGEIGKIFPFVQDPLADLNDPICGVPGVDMGPCHYSISNETGDGPPRTDNFRICFYLETGFADLPAGFNSIVTDGYFVEGCL